MDSDALWICLWDWILFCKKKAFMEHNSVHEGVAGTGASFMERYRVTWAEKCIETFE